ncbi:hypothetical protein [Deinococcus cellulosilyticus]|uniref:HNH nuclease domain-containing protein n=1 Tax=Deinococcus cellulosilyticus (strain DSM 18568 / NBRC 106333 / KACC 11606 / 5516J-15) TaxID=1223518 RepID=A0A511MWR2_DEIC1|nr:hypothetical protein [Deinococcus cellulosilyticus]GEM44708.1 hypothetical protein DC3_03430 [Deinococcus cellulosilyticus NBRC 106333 = KACC 11606]
MIDIVFNRKDARGKDIRPNKTWFNSAAKHTALAIAETENPAIGKHEARSSVYGHDQVRMALEKLFYGKCAYCETRITGAVWDIEHYRPKGAVANCPGHPGYYWLIYDWNNLLPSCAPCNQNLSDRPLWDDPTRIAAAGKFTQFPLKDETKRVRHPSGNLLDEAPLLLHPCVDHPEAEIKYSPLGRIIERGASDRLKATIRICNLKRRRLVRNRHSAIQRTIRLLRLIHNLETLGHTQSLAEAKQLLEEHFISNEAEYAGAARNVCNEPARFGV